MKAKSNSMFSFESDVYQLPDVVAAKVETIPVEEIEKTFSEDGEVADQALAMVNELSDQNNDIAEAINHTPEEVTEELVQEHDKRFISSLSKLGINPKHIKLGCESSGTSVSKLKVTQEGIIDTIKSLLKKLWEWLKKMGRKIIDFFKLFGTKVKLRVYGYDPRILNIEWTKEMINSHNITSVVNIVPLIGLSKNGYDVFEFVTRKYNLDQRTMIISPMYVTSIEKEFHNTYGNVYLDKNPNANADNTTIAYLLHNGGEKYRVTILSKDDADVMGGTESEIEIKEDVHTTIIKKFKDSNFILGLNRNADKMNKEKEIFFTKTMPEFIKVLENYIAAGLKTIDELGNDESKIIAVKNGIAYAKTLLQLDNKMKTIVWSGIVQISEMLSKEYNKLVGKKSS